MLLALGILGAQAQLRYGVTLGGVWARPELKDVNGDELSRGGGFSGGLTLEWQAPRCGFALDISALYTRYNSQLKCLLEGAPTMFKTQDYGRNFIEVPLHAKYKFFMMKDLFAPLVYTGPSLMINLDNKDAQLQQHRLQPGWDLGIGFDIVNFVQLTAGYRFGLGNACSSYAGAPDATLRTNGWHLKATLLFDF